MGASFVGFALLLLLSLEAQSAPVAEDSTDLQSQDSYPAEGCYYNLEHYEEGDRIVTNEPCLNCTCHNHMLMCYLRVCPFTKAIGQDCTVEKRPDQCCPVITCPEVPVQLLTSSTTQTPTTPSTAVGRPDNFGCTLTDNTFYPDGAQVPSDPRKPCELCYCIRNRTACVMQECTLQVEGCQPVYQQGVCCPVRYDCDYDSVTTPGTTVGLVTTPGGPSQCLHDGVVYNDGEMVEFKGKSPCEHCYCMRGDVVCAVQECGAPLQAPDCVPLPPPPGHCCPDTFQCANGTVPLETLLGKPESQEDSHSSEVQSTEAGSTDETANDSAAEGSESSEEQKKPQDINTEDEAGGGSHDSSQKGENNVNDESEQKNDITSTQKPASSMVDDSAENQTPVENDFVGLGNQQDFANDNEINGHHDAPEDNHLSNGQLPVNDPDVVYGEDNIKPDSELSAESHKKPAEGESSTNNETENEVQENQNDDESKTTEGPIEKPTNIDGASHDDETQSNMNTESEYTSQSSTEPGYAGVSNTEHTHGGDSHAEHVGESNGQHDGESNAEHDGENNGQQNGESNAEHENASVSNTEPDNADISNTEPINEGESNSEHENTGESSHEYENTSESNHKHENVDESNVEQENASESNTEHENAGISNTEPENDVISNNVPLNAVESNTEYENAGANNNEPHNAVESNIDHENAGVNNAEPENDFVSNNKPLNAGDSNIEHENPGSNDEHENSSESNAEHENAGVSNNESENGGVSINEPINVGENNKEHESDGESHTEHEIPNESNNVHENTDENNNANDNADENNNVHENTVLSNTEPEKTGESNIEHENAGESNSDHENTDESGSQTEQTEVSGNNKDDPFMNIPDNVQTDNTETDLHSENDSHQSTDQTTPNEPLGTDHDHIDINQHFGESNEGNDFSNNNNIESATLTTDSEAHEGTFEAGANQADNEETMVTGDHDEDHKHTTVYHDIHNVNQGATDHLSHDGTTTENTDNHGSNVETPINDSFTDSEENHNASGSYDSENFDSESEKNKVNAVTPESYTEVSVETVEVHTSTPEINRPYENSTPQTSFIEDSSQSTEGPIIQDEVHSSIYPTSQEQNEVTLTHESSSSAPEEHHITTVINSGNIPRIPGEGSCAIDGRTFQNNTDVPPSNACQLSCLCRNSIIHCKLVECPPPPTQYTNCMPLQESDSCCPSYTCDDKPSVPLESHSQVSTEYPDAAEQDESSHQESYEGSHPVSHVPSENEVPSHDQAHSSSEGSEFLPEEDKPDQFKPSIEEVSGSHKYNEGTVSTTEGDTENKADGAKPEQDNLPEAVLTDDSTSSLTGSDETGINANVNEEIPSGINTEKQKEPEDNFGENESKPSVQSSANDSTEFPQNSEDESHKAENEKETESLSNVKPEGELQGVEGTTIHQDGLIKPATSTPDNVEPTEAHVSGSEYHIPTITSPHIDFSQDSEDKQQGHIESSTEKSGTYELPNEDVTGAQPHESPEAHPHESSETPSHESSETPSHDSTMAHSHDSTETYPHESTETHPHDSTEAHPHESTEAHPHESTDAHPHDSTEAHLHESTEAHPHESTEAHPHESTEAHPHESTEAHSHESTETHTHESTEPLAHESTETYPHESTEAHFHGSTEAHPHESSETPSHDSTTVHSHDSTMVHSHDSTETYPHESTEAHPQESTEAHLHESTEAHPHESTEAHPHESTETHPHESTEAHPHESTEAHLHESTEAHPHESTEAQPHESTEAHPHDFADTHPNDFTNDPSQSEEGIAVTDHALTNHGENNVALPEQTILNQVGNNEVIHQAYPPPDSPAEHSQDSTISSMGTHENEHSSNLNNKEQGNLSEENIQPGVSGSTSNEETNDIPIQEIIYEGDIRPQENVESQIGHDHQFTENSAPSNEDGQVVSEEENKVPETDPQNEVGQDTSESNEINEEHPAAPITDDQISSEQTDVENEGEVGPSKEQTPENDHTIANVITDTHSSSSEGVHHDVLEESNPDLTSGGNDDLVTEQKQPQNIDNTLPGQEAEHDTAHNEVGVEEVAHIPQHENDSPHSSEPISTEQNADHDETASNETTDKDGSNGIQESHIDSENAEPDEHTESSENSNHSNDLSHPIDSSQTGSSEIGSEHLPESPDSNEEENSISNDTNDHDPTDNSEKPTSPDFSGDTTGNTIPIADGVGGIVHHETPNEIEPIFVGVDSEHDTNNEKPDMNETPDHEAVPISESEEKPESPSSAEENIHKYPVTTENENEHHDTASFNKDETNPDSSTNSQHSDGEIAGVNELTTEGHNIVASEQHNTEPESGEVEDGNVSGEDHHHREPPTSDEDQTVPVSSDNGEENHSNPSSTEVLAGHSDKPSLSEVDESQAEGSSDGEIDNQDVSLSQENLEGTSHDPSENHENGPVMTHDDEGTYNGDHQQPTELHENEGVEVSSTPAAEENKHDESASVESGEVQTSAEVSENHQDSPTSSESGEHHDAISSGEVTDGQKEPSSSEEHEVPSSSEIGGHQDVPVSASSEVPEDNSQSSGEVTEGQNEQDEGHETPVSSESDVHQDDSSHSETSEEGSPQSSSESGLMPEHVSEGEEHPHIPETAVAEEHDENQNDHIESEEQESHPHSEEHVHQKEPTLTDSGESGVVESLNEHESDHNDGSSSSENEAHSEHPTDSSDIAGNASNEGTNVPDDEVSLHEDNVEPHLTVADHHIEEPEPVSDSDHNTSEEQSNTSSPSETDSFHEPEKTQENILPTGPEPSEGEEHYNDHESGEQLVPENVHSSPEHEKPDHETPTTNIDDGIHYNLGSEERPDENLPHDHTSEHGQQAISDSSQSVEDSDSVGSHTEAPILTQEPNKKPTDSSSTDQINEHIEPESSGSPLDAQSQEQEADHPQNPSTYDDQSNKGSPSYETGHDTPSEGSEVAFPHDGDGSPATGLADSDAVVNAIYAVVHQQEGAQHVDAENKPVDQIPNLPEDQTLEVGYEGDNVNDGHSEEHKETEEHQAEPENRPPVQHIPAPEPSEHEHSNTEVDHVSTHTPLEDHHSETGPNEQTEQPHQEELQPAAGQGVNEPHSTQSTLEDGKHEVEEQNIQDGNESHSPDNKDSPQETQNENDLTNTQPESSDLSNAPSHPVHHTPTYSQNSEDDHPTVHHTPTYSQSSEDHHPIIHPGLDDHMKPSTEHTFTTSMQGMFEPNLPPGQHQMHENEFFQPGGPLFQNWPQKPMEHGTTTKQPQTSAHIPDDSQYPDEQLSDDYEEDSNYSPGTCRYGGKVYLSAQQIPRDDPCDFCFCFRSDIICLQQSCPPPIQHCYQENIPGFCCPRYECHVSMATMVNVTTTTTTTTTTLPPHFLAHAYKGAAKRTGCQVKGVAYRVGERIPSTSGPCLECRCGADGQMKCDPTVCNPQETLLRQVMDAAVINRRRRHILDTPYFSARRLR